MKAEIQWNILSVGGLHDKAALVRHIAATAPHEAMLVMNDTSFAVELSQYVRHMIHRTQFKGDNEIFRNAPNTAQGIRDSAIAFVDGLPDIGENIYHQILNEPGGGQLDEIADQRWMANWTAAAMTYAASRPKGRRKRLAGPSHAVGNPHESFFGLGVYDPILRALRAENGILDWHLILQHEYFVTNAADEQPHHIGRVLNWRTRARYVGVPEPKVVIGEAGRDVGGGKGVGGDGWKNAKWEPKTPEEYMKRLVSQAAVYRPYGYPMLVFCVGEGFGDWISFDVQKEESIFVGATAYNKTVPDIPIGVITVAPVPLPPETPTKIGKVVSMPAAFVNLREAPNAASADVGDVLLNESVGYGEPTQYPDWYWVKKTNGLFGWISKQKTASTPVVIEPLVTNPPVVINNFTKAELETLGRCNREIAAVYEAAAARL